MTTIEQHTYLLATAEADHAILWDHGEIITMLTNYHSFDHLVCSCVCCYKISILPFAHNETAGYNTMGQVLNVWFISL